MQSRYSLHKRNNTVITRSVVSFILASLLLAGCEKPFEPLATSDLAFSIYGHLDATADTQWVRVMPFRESLITQTGPIDAVVTLEELETGTTVVMSDSVFRYLSVFLGDGDLYAHNFSTTMAMVPGRHYRLTATRSDGATASATVLIPIFEYPTLEVRHGSAPTAQGTIRGTRFLAMVLGREEVPSPAPISCVDFRLPVHQEFLPVTRPATFEGDDHGVQLSWPLEGFPSRPSYVSYPPPCPLKPKRVIAVASGEPWVYGATTSLRELSHPTSINNIEGRGIGFFAGVQTHVFPFAECTPLAGSNLCTITFDPRSATLVGVVTSSCTGEPIAPKPPDFDRPKAVRVRLLGPPANGIRYDITDASGVFRFEGLEPGAAHSLALEQLPDFVFGVEHHPVEIENLVLGEAAVDTIAIEMTRRGNCPP